MRFDRRKTYPLNEKDGSLGQRLTDWFASKAIVPTRVGGVIKQLGEPRFLEPLNRAVVKLKHPYLWKIQSGKMTSGGTSSQSGNRPLPIPSLNFSPPPPEAPPPPPGSMQLRVSVSLPQALWSCPTFLGGTYDFTVYYGDDSPAVPVTASSDDNASHRYAAPGIYDVWISGQFEGWFQSLIEQFSVVTEVLTWGDSTILDITGQVFLGKGGTTAGVPLLPASESLPVSVSCFQIELEGCPNTGPTGEIVKNLTLAANPSTSFNFKGTSFSEIDFTGTTSAGAFTFQDTFQNMEQLTVLDFSGLGTFNCVGLNSMIKFSAVTEVNFGTMVMDANTQQANSFRSMFDSAAQLNSIIGLETVDYSQLNGSLAMTGLYRGTGFQTIDLAWMAQVPTAAWFAQGTGNSCQSVPNLTTVLNAQNLPVAQGAGTNAFGLNSLLSTIQGHESIVVGTGSTFTNMFSECHSITALDFSAWVFPFNAGGFVGFLTNVPLDTASYDVLLQQIAATVTVPGTLDANLCTYTAGGAAEAARTTLTGLGWTITDAGPA